MALEARKGPRKQGFCWEKQRISLASGAEEPAPDSFLQRNLHFGKAGPESGLGAGLLARLDLIRRQGTGPVLMELRNPLAPSYSAFLACTEA